MTRLSLYHVDPTRLDFITAGGLRALDECAGRSAEIDERIREMRRRRERAALAMDAVVGQARESRPAQPTTAVSPARILRLGAEEFREVERAARPPKPQPRPTPAASDDDLSGRTWLR